MKKALFAFGLFFGFSTVVHAGGGTRMGRTADPTVAYTTMDNMLRNFGLSCTELSVLINLGLKGSPLALSPKEKQDLAKVEDKIKQAGKAVPGGGPMNALGGMMSQPGWELAFKRLCKDTVVAEDAQGDDVAQNDEEPGTVADAVQSMLGN